MRKMKLLAALWVLLAGLAVQAQTFLDLPRDSQHAQVRQRLGITDISIDYSRPLVKGRKIWGGLVPYDKVWRAGANENTVIEFSAPVTVEGKALPAGRYGLHMIPGQNDWTVIFSKNSTSWGSFTYDQAEDALRVTVKPHAADLQEALAYDFDALQPDSTMVTMRWEKLAVPFRVSADVDKTVADSFHQQLRGQWKYTWEGWYEAADYLLNKKLDPADALEYANQSINQEERFDTLMLKARALEATSRASEAGPLRDRALAMANALQLNSYGRSLQIKGQQDQAFEIFRLNGQRNPGHFIVHYEVARMAVAKGDYDNAVKEMQQAIEKSPDGFRPFFESLLNRLQAKEDINR